MKNKGKNMKMFVRSLLLGLGIAICINVAAKQITVDDDGKADFKRIQNAITAAKEGDLIQVAPGRYAENIKLKGKVILQGASAETTVITSRGDEPYKQVVLVDEADSKISGFTIDGQEEVHGIVSTFSTLIVSNNFITHTLTAIDSVNSNVAITDNKIEENRSGVFIAGTSEADIGAKDDFGMNSIYNNGVEIKISFGAMAKKEFFAIGNFWGTPEGPIAEATPRQDHMVVHVMVKLTVHVAVQIVPLHTVSGGMAKALLAEETLLSVTRPVATN